MPPPANLFQSVGRLRDLSASHGMTDKILIRFPILVAI